MANSMEGTAVCDQIFPWTSHMSRPITLVNFSIETAIPVVHVAGIQAMYLRRDGHFMMPED